MEEKEPLKPSSGTPNETQKKEPSGSSTGKVAPEELFQQTSTSSDGQLKSSNDAWQRPTDLNEFTSQVLSVSTMLLNGKIDMELARTYSSLARTISQSITASLVRARLMKEEPDLEFEED